MPGRTFNPTTSRFGFQGKEKVDEIAGVPGAHYDFGARMYESRLGRWMRPDPHTSNYPSISPYVFCANNPIANVDPHRKAIVYFNTQGKEAHRVKK